MFSLWRTIEVGTDHSMSDLIRSTSLEGYGVDYEWTQGRSALLRGAPVAICRSRLFPRETLNLTRITPAGLGLTGERKCSEIIAQGQEMGLRLCPLEAALQLRRQYSDQPSGEILLMAMVKGDTIIIAHDNSEYLGDSRESSESLKRRYYVTDNLPTGTWRDSSSWIFLSPGT